MAIIDAGIWITYKRRNSARIASRGLRSVRTTRTMIRVPIERTARRRVMSGKFDQK